MSVEKKRQILAKRKEQYQKFLDETPLPEKVDIVKDWASNLESDRFNTAELDKIRKRYEDDPNHKMVKGDNVYINTIFVTNNINPAQHRK